MSVREDKGIEDASTPEFLANMYRSQQAAGKDQTGADEGELVDVVNDGEEEEDMFGDDTEEVTPQQNLKPVSLNQFAGGEAEGEFDEDDYSSSEESDDD